MAGAELPAVIINIMRAGPGLGGILPAQADYFQATKGGGHGDYRLLTLAPATVQEMVDLTILAFDLADRYRNPVMLLADGALGQMMEPVEFPHAVDPADLHQKPWATTGCAGRERNIINSLYLDSDMLEAHNRALTAKYRAMQESEVRYETWRLDEGCDVLIVAYGIVARIARTAVEALRERGVRAALFRPITLYPFPSEAIAEAARAAQAVLVAELSCGQMVEDVRSAVAGGRPVSFFGRTGGSVMGPEEIEARAEEALTMWGVGVPG